MESGSSTVLMLAGLGLLAVVAVATVGLGLALAARVGAQNAADGAALAAAVATFPAASDSGPDVAAREVAIANGAGLVACRCPIDSSLNAREVTVVTTMPVNLPVLGDWTVRAVSTAEFDPLRWLGP